MTGCGQYVKMFITLEIYGMFESYFAYLLFNIVQPLVCKMVKRLWRASFWLFEVF